MYLDLFGLSRTQLYLFGRWAILGSMLTGNCASILCSCGPLRTPELARNSSSVRMVPRERLICAASGMLARIQYMVCEMWSVIKRWMMIAWIRLPVFQDERGWRGDGGSVSDANAGPRLADDEGEAPRTEVMDLDQIRRRKSTTVHTLWWIRAAGLPCILYIYINIYLEQ